MKPKLILCLALVLNGALFGLFAPQKAHGDPTATNILNNLFATKTLVLASRPKLIISSDQRQTSSNSPTLNYVDIIAPKMIDRFSFKAQISRPGHPLIVMHIAADHDHATVLLQTADGQPYFLMADHLCVICDQDNPGELAYYDGGTVQWGLFQSVDRTNADFQMTFIGTNVPSAVIFDLRFIIQGSLAKMTSMIYLSDNNTIKISSSRGSVGVTLVKDDPNNPFGVAEVKIQNGDSVFDFSDFKVGAMALKGQFQFTTSDLQKLGVPLRALDVSDLNRLNPYIPQGFPNSEKEKEAARKLQSLIWEYKSVQRLDYPGLNNNACSSLYAFPWKTQLSNYEQQGWIVDSVSFKEEGLASGHSMQAAIIVLKRVKK